VTEPDQFTIDFDESVEVEIQPRGEPSPEQRNVLDFDADLVVTAGAGSGKTSFLVDLYMEILNWPALVSSSPEEIGPGRILCLTFTERAAREIQGRIRRRIERVDWLRELETAPIQTFHAWCARLLRDFPLEAGIDPHFSVLTQDGAEDLLRRASVETLRRGLESGDEPCRRVVELHGLAQAARFLADLVRSLRTAGWDPLRALARFEERVAEAGAESGGRLRAELDEAVTALVDAIRPAARTVNYRDRLARLEQAFAAWRKDASFETGEGLGLAIKDARGAKPEREAALGAHAAWWSARIEVDRAHDIGVWVSLATTVRAEYRAARVARATLDYDDLLLRVREVLTSHDTIRRAYRGRYRAILIDEHQDTDPVQHEILQLLVGADSLSGRRSEGDPRWCVVGDVQQAIYGFRGASVEAFTALVQGATERGALRRLPVNYRSRRELVDFYNAFFPSVLTFGPKAEAIAYVAQEAHQTPMAGLAVEILEPSDDRPAAEAREIEARALAARLRAAIDPTDPDAVWIIDKETRERRASRAGDVAILFRRLTQIEPYRRALQAVGLEPVVVGSGEFYARQEVFDVLSAFEAALAPEDPIPLVAFLRSPMVGLPDDAIWRLTRGWDRHSATLRRHIELLEDPAWLEAEERERLDEAQAVLDELAARADLEPPGAILTWLVDRTGYAAVLEALPDHAQRRANLARLLSLADGAPAEGAPLLADWVTMLRARADRPPRGDRDASLPEPGDRVTIMSIHQAKGLEFPIVALGDIGGTIRAGLGGVAFDPGLGIVAKWWEDGGAKGEPTRSYLLAKEAAKPREEAEEARLLYVAATRARDHLIFSAGSRGARPSPWLASALKFLESPAAEGLVIARSLEAWADRHGSSVLEIEFPDAGAPYRPVLPTAAGELTARDLAAAFAEEVPVPLPAAARETARLSMRRGARAHHALERLPIQPAPGFDLGSWLGASGVEEPDLTTVAAFVESDVWPRLRGAAAVHRELPFRLRLPEPGGIVVGTIDAIWRDADGAWWVWDYKLAADDGHESRHETQLEIYALAAARALGVDDMRGALWYLESRTGREFRWDRTALLETETKLAVAFSRVTQMSDAHVIIEEDA
jgi:ATP-dependent helicase/nuclease subunit A